MPDRQVRLLFPAVGEMRLYAAAGAPLRRVEFEVGSEVEDHEGQRLRVEEVRDDEGVLTYVGGGLEIPEALLSDRLCRGSNGSFAYGDLICFRSTICGEECSISTTIGLEVRGLSEVGST